MRTFLWLMLPLFLLASCSDTRLLSQTCQANASLLMPSNQVPPGGQIRRGAYSGNVTEGIDFLTIASDLTVGELLVHYSNQTTEQESNWSLLDSGGDSHTAWSSWTVVDDCGKEWDGLIMISKPPSTTDPFVVIRVKKRN